GEPEKGMMGLLGLKGAKLTKNAIAPRTLLELPLMTAIDTLKLGDGKVAAVGMKQVLVPGKATVLGTWSDGSAAVTIHKHGKGQAFAVGTLAGAAYIK